jgi:cyclohexanone monooxygenase
MTTQTTTAPLDAIIVGAGFAGLYMLHRLRKSGFNARVVEAGSGAGGTWFWNRYPGARVDIESMQYSYKFSDELAQEWNWSERYATQPELLTYVAHVIERFQLADGIQYNTRVNSAKFNDSTGLWDIDTNDGQLIQARHCIMATGCLSSTNEPSFPGQNSFKGETYHTGRWPKEGVDFTGKTVVVIGTGSSSIQSIPEIAKQAKQLYVLQRTANYSVPAHNQPLDPAYVADIKANYGDLRARGLAQPLAYDINLNPKLCAELPPEEVRAELDRRWAWGGLPIYGAFADLLVDANTNRIVADYMREKIRSIVKEARTAELLSPKGTFGCKRVCVDTGYYQTYNLPHVELVDISQIGVEEITATGVRAGGRVIDTDVIVFATGFDAMTGSLDRINIRGRGDVALKDKWAAGPITYLGLMSAGFPNLFTITGPGSPSVLTNMIMAIEQHVDFITDCLEYLRANGINHIEPRHEVELVWGDHVQEVANGTLLYSCNSWYLGANVPGKPRVFMPYLGYPAYAEKCRDVAANGYEGFDLSAA